MAEIRLVEGPPTVSRDNAQRRVVVQCNVRDRDVGGFVEQARQAVQDRVVLPPGYFATWGGQFENQQRAQQTLTVVAPVCLGPRNGATATHPKSTRQKSTWRWCGKRSLN